MRDRIMGLITQYVKPNAAQRRSDRMRLDMDETILPGGLWWLCTVLIGVGGTIVYAVHREWLLGFAFGRFLAAPLDMSIDEATNAFHATVAVILVTLPMLPVAVLAAGASSGERREIYYLLHAGFKTLTFGNYPKSSSRTLRTKIVRHLLWIGDIALAKVGASIAATTLGISLYSEAQGSHHPLVTIGSILITYALFLYPRVIRAAMAARYRSHKRY